MTTAQALMAAALIAPFATAMLAAVFARTPFLRDMIAVFGAFAGFVLLAALLAATPGASARLIAAELAPGLMIVFHAEPMGLAFAATIGFAHCVGAVFAVGARAAPDGIGPTRLLAASAAAAGLAIALALSENLITWFVADLGLTFAAFALLAGAGVEARPRGAQTFLVLNLVLAAGLLAPAIVWAGQLSGGFDFLPGGRFTTEADVGALNFLLILFVLGAAKAGPLSVLMWVRRSAELPAAALSTVIGAAVLGAGAFGILKIALFLFGAGWIAALWSAKMLLGLALVVFVWASLQALAERAVAGRLAYAAAAQAALVSAGAMLGAPSAAFGAVLHLIGACLALTALILATGVVRQATDRTETTAFDGLGRRMPYTFLGFALGALALAGMAPTAGAWAKLWLATGGVGVGLDWAAAGLAVGAALSFAYTVPLTARALFEAPPKTPFTRADATGPMVLAPVLVAGFAAAGLVMIADPIAYFVSQSLAPP